MLTIAGTLRQLGQVQPTSLCQRTSCTTRTTCDSVPAFFGSAVFGAHSWTLAGNHTDASSAWGGPNIWNRLKRVLEQWPS